MPSLVRSIGSKVWSLVVPLPTITESELVTLRNTKTVPLFAVLRFEADVEHFIRQGGDKDLTFDANLTGYQVAI